MTENRTDWSPYLLDPAGSIAFRSDVAVTVGVKATQPALVEKALHQRCASKRVRGEWFDLGEQDLKGFTAAVEGEHVPR
jgi:hypothetical protein